MKIKLIALIPLVVALLLIYKFYLALGNDPSILPSALLDKPLPEFSLQSLHQADNTITRQDIIGKIMLINVWATWCPACYKEHDKLVELAEKEKIPIVGLNYKDDRNKALAYLEKYKNPYEQVLFDADGRFGIELGVYGAPETYLVDASGIIRFRHAGELTSSIWKEEFLPKIKMIQGG